MSYHNLFFQFNRIEILTSRPIWNRYHGSRLCVYSTWMNIENFIDSFKLNILNTQLVIYV